MADSPDTQVCSSVTRGVCSTLEPKGRKWFCDYLPITRGNDVKLYVDGQAYCKDLHDALLGAAKQVFLTGLHFMSDFRLVRSGSKDADMPYWLASVLEQLARRNVKIYLLVNQFWPDERTVKNPIKIAIKKGGELDAYLPESVKLFKLLQRFPSVQCRTDIHPGFLFHSNHQKTVVIDDKTAFLGGIDLTHVDGDRWDTPSHKADLRDVDRTNKYWHDVHLRLTGPAIDFVRDNFHARWNHGDLYTLADGWRTLESCELKRFPPYEPIEVCRKYQEYYIEATRDSNHHVFPRIQLPNPRYPSGTESAKKPAVQIVRSMPHGNYVKGKQKPDWNKSDLEWERSCKDAYLIGIRAARQFIYLENQWISDESIWDELAAAARRNRSNASFRIVIMLPRKPLWAAGLGANQDISQDGKIKAVIQNSRDFKTFGVYCLVQKFPAAGKTSEVDIYVHSKIMIVDDCWSLIGSANAGGISLEGIRGWLVGSGDHPDTELSAIILDENFARSFRTRLWSEHLQKPEAQVRDPLAGADALRNRALAGGQRVRFFGAYRKQLDGYAHTTSVVDPEVVKGCREKGRIASIPPATSRQVSLAGLGAFEAVLPGLPPFYKAWYRWSCRDSDDNSYLMRGFTNHEVVQYYGDECRAYLGEKTRQLLSSRLARSADKSGKILCRVEITPPNLKPNDHSPSKQDSFALEYPCRFAT